MTTNPLSKLRLAGYGSLTSIQATLQSGPAGARVGGPVVELIDGRAKWNPDFKNWLIPRVHAGPLLADIGTCNFTGLQRGSEAPRSCQLRIANGSRWTCSASARRFSGYTSVSGIARRPRAEPARG